jgi:hypothetical protein
VVEFATHATLASSGPGQPALLLAAGAKPDDIILTASQAASLHISANSVLLWLNFGSPDRAGAPGLLGLTRAFLALALARCWCRTGTSTMP